MSMTRLLSIVAVTLALPGLLFAQMAPKPNGTAQGFVYLEGTDGDPDMFSLKLHKGSILFSEGKIAFVSYGKQSARRDKWLEAEPMEPEMAFLQPMDPQNYRFLPGEPCESKIRSIISGKNILHPSFSSIILKNIENGQEVLMRFDGKRLLLEPSEPIALQLMAPGTTMERHEGFVEFSKGNTKLQFSDEAVYSQNTETLDETTLYLSNTRSNAMWVTYFGGASSDYIYSICNDQNGNAYVTGVTYGGNFPISTGAMQGSFAGLVDSYVSAFDKDGALLWSTYYGGENFEEGYRVKVSHDGKIVITGRTNSPDLLMSPNAFQTTTNGTYAAFILVLKSNGDFDGATYYRGGTGGVQAYDMDIDSQNNIIIGGTTSSPDLPGVQGSFQPNWAGFQDSYVAKFTSVSNLAWATYYGGSLTEDVHVLRVDKSDNIIFSGETGSTDFPVSNGAFQSQNKGLNDIYFVKLSPTGTRLWATLMGGSDREDVNGLAIDSLGNIYFGGFSKSDDFPMIVTDSIYITVKHDFEDMIFGKLSAQGVPQWTTFWGGNGFEQVYDLAINAHQHIFATGETSSAGFPVIGDSLQTGPLVQNEVALVVFDRDGRVSQSGYFGGSQFDIGRSISLWNDSIVYIGGITESPNFPVTPGAYQPNPGNTWDVDGFISVLNGRNWYTILPPDTSDTTNTVNINRIIGNNYVIFPNPVMGQLFVGGLQDGVSATGRLYDHQGKLVMEKKGITSNNYSITVEELPKGFYILRIFTDVSENFPPTTHKFIKN